MASSAHLWRSVDSLQPAYCSWMGFAGSTSPSLWLGNFSGWNSNVRRIRRTKRPRLERTFSRNVQLIVTLACTVLTARGQFTLQAERARPHYKPRSDLLLRVFDKYFCQDFQQFAVSQFSVDSNNLALPIDENWTRQSVNFKC